MPRINTSLSDPLDFCKSCFPDAILAKERYGHLGDGPDGRGNCFSWNDEHPDYTLDEYFCESCGKVLTARDD